MDKDIIKFLFELGQLKRIKNSGFRLIGIDNPASVGAHSLRAAQIGYMLAKMEKYANPVKICAMLVFHDIGECRTGDINRVENRYIEVKEEEAVKQQLEPLGELGKEIFELWEKSEEKESIEGMIAKDADMLEHSLTAKEYVEQGFEYAQDWIDNSARCLRTASGRKLMEAMKQSNSNEWWQGLKKFKSI